ncbi:biotin--[acetyl-CoA-carboxylase] ligase [Bifidobacterium amazonense]|uniref:Biotin--[acetyl-CoA-carboxylase] ligase n=1 Tax=Bifidobacterium amazonense TaxID=2809027 RepID=A0ABS9VXA3_9BIFI|nr:biotin--[acetyl-CoA-carboxylase] ligase [Bifidobacterium amazonense]MCH9276750.1 biotin--[acetyl-CoA-carboxylase] ligase [Bifidobacterium amazonense]
MISMLKIVQPHLDATERVADKTVTFAEIDSTHAQARRMIESGDIARDAERGISISVVAADSQTNGLARFGRPWISNPGHSFTMSFIAVIPRAVAEDELINGWLSMIAGLATLDALENTLDECGAHSFYSDCGFNLKWPNDVYCHGLKLGGTFTESVPLPDDDVSMAVVFSIGINLMMPADRLPTAQATSLQMHFAPLPPIETLRDMIAARLVESLRTRLESFVEMPIVQASRLRSEMRHVCWMMGRDVEAQLIDGSEVRGTVVALNDDASISVRLASGDTQDLLASEVSVLS